VDCRFVSARIGCNGTLAPKSGGYIKGDVMRFVIAFILVVLYGFMSLATSKGFSDVGILISYLLGGAILGPALVAALFCIPKSGRNNKRFFRVFNVVLLLSIFGQAGQMARLAEVAERPPKKILGSSGRVEVTVPETWVSEEVPNEDIVLYLKDGSGYLDIIVGYESAGIDRLDMEHYAQLMGNNFKRKIPDFESISKIERCESTKLECVYQIVYTSAGKKGTATILASLSGEEGYYNFIATTNPGLVEEYRSDIFNVLRSLNEVQK